MYSRILTCDYEFVSPWWDEVSLNAKDLVSDPALAFGAAQQGSGLPDVKPSDQCFVCKKNKKNNKSTSSPNRTAAS